MRGAICASALLMAVAAAAAAAVSEESLEDEVEAAPFVIVVEHEDGWRCGGAMVTLRTALSTASCARGRTPAPPDNLWARAPGTAPAYGFRRITRVAVANDSQGSAESEKWTEGAWIGVVMDMALLELEAPFSAVSGVRPILMAIGDECEPQSSASVCAILHTPLQPGAPLRVGNVERVSPTNCDKVATHWSAIEKTALCLIGPQFCQSDWGAGVVCSGKLCGLLSRSTNGAASGGAGDGAPGCGNTHAALHVPRWQGFVRCAQTGRRCGRDDCASVCTERMLIDELVNEKRGEEASGDGGGGGGEGGRGSGDGGGGGDDEGGGGGGSVGGEDGGGNEEGREDEEDGRARDGTKRRIPHHTTRVEIAGALPTRTAPVPEPRVPEPREPEPRVPELPTPEPPIPQPLPPPSPTSSSGGRAPPFEFEPNRADFRVGEYGDNAANYETGEELVRTSTSTASSAGSQEAEVVALVERSQNTEPSPAPSPRSIDPQFKRTATENSAGRNTLLSVFEICLRHIFVIIVLL